MSNQTGSGGVRVTGAYDYSLEELEKNLHETDLERFLKIALKAEDYRSAVRIYYLTAIKRLSQLKWIDWQLDKTNYDYVRELREHEAHGEFRSLTHTFELIWYGEAPVSEKEYSLLSPHFDGFIQQLNATTENGAERN
ncbi:MAG: DUF4129 domain-containing protein [Flavobacteriales bacterium]|nr:DUF4129 domain-containing protein [Flavobacteriales bacterium]